MYIYYSFEMKMFLAFKKFGKTFLSTLKRGTCTFVNFDFQAKYIPSIFEVFQTLIIYKKNSNVLIKV